MKRTAENLKTILFSIRWIDSIKGESIQEDMLNKPLLVSLLLFSVQVVRSKLSTVSLALNPISALGKRDASHQIKTFLEIFYKTQLLNIFFIYPLNFLYERIYFQLKQLLNRQLLTQVLKKQVEAGALQEVDGSLFDDVEKFVSLSMNLVVDNIQGMLHLFQYTSFMFATLKKLNGRETNSLRLKLLSLALLSSFFSTAFFIKFGRSLSLLHRKERDAESNLKFSLSRIKENSDSIGFYLNSSTVSSSFEMKQIENDLLETQQFSVERKNAKELISNSQTFFRKVIAQVPILLLLKSTSNSHEHGHSHLDSNPTHSHGHSHSHSNHSNEPSLPKLDLFLGITEAFNELVFHFSMLAENFNDISKLEAISDKIVLLLKKRPETNMLFSQNSSPKSPYLALQNLVLKLPNGQELFKPVNLSVKQGDKILIKGMSGIGKTSLLKAISGIWARGTGRIEGNASLKTLFIPQKPYLCIGTLRQQVLYPDFELKVDTGVLVKLFEQVGLKKVLETCNYDLEARKDWAKILSLGEQQRVAFIRLFIQKPDLVVMDEATSGCDLASEKRMYQLLGTWCDTWISVGHRSTLDAYHKSFLTLEPPSKL
eukprot:maker-scaffold_14-snap-gene-9.32-mRNA-1 protein AED:0.04 eAED:0.04 QI:91/0.5/0.33/1/1/1/3/0/597